MKGKDRRAGLTESAKSDRVAEIKEAIVREVGREKSSPEMLRRLVNVMEQALALDGAMGLDGAAGSDDNLPYSGGGIGIMTPRPLRLGAGIGDGPLENMMAMIEKVMTSNQGAPAFRAVESIGGLRKLYEKDSGKLKEIEDGLRSAVERAVKTMAGNKEV